MDRAEVPVVATVVLILVGGWHLAAAWHFLGFPERTLARTTQERPIRPIAAELFRFLGGMNLGMVVLAWASVAGGSRGPALLALAVANGSQLAVDLRVRRLGLARGAMFAQILAGDAVFTVAPLAALAIGSHG
jgi:hypothetical protein